ncbi:hypothetical protein D5S17_09405 [Pseudonocardiaceae bacterium YIM PH 21723]|nr:hypothetical protein D5S17_09405 [Pseudonocardiaceae bacterium YIM PH 21723]
MPRIHDVILPVLREQLPGVQVVSWIPDVDHREYPILGIRRLSGLARDVRRLDLPVVEMTAYHRDGLVPCEDLYLDARQVLWDMVKNQTLTPAGYLHSFFETFGPSQFDSPFDDSWRVQGLIQLGLRPAR